MSRELIACDFDEVIFPFTPVFLQHHNQKYGTGATENHVYKEALVAALGVTRCIDWNAVEQHFDPASEAVA